MNISLKEVGEAEYWIEFLMATEYLNEKEGYLSGVWNGEFI